MPTENETAPAAHTMWKYMLGPADIVVHDIPVGAKALSVGPDPQGNIAVWFIVAPDQPTEKRAIVLVGTGGPVPSNAAKDFLGTFVVGEYVWHAFTPPMSDVVQKAS